MPDPNKTQPPPPQVVRLHDDEDDGEDSSNDAVTRIATADIAEAAIRELMMRSEGAPVAGLPTLDTQQDEQDDEEDQPTSVGTPAPAILATIRAATGEQVDPAVSQAKTKPPPPPSPNVEAESDVTETEPKNATKVIAAVSPAVQNGIPRDSVKPKALAPPPLPPRPKPPRPAPSAAKSAPPLPRIEDSSNNEAPFLQPSEPKIAPARSEAPPLSTPSIPVAPIPSLPPVKSALDSERSRSGADATSLRPPRSPIPYVLPEKPREKHWTDYATIVGIVGFLLFVAGLLAVLLR